MYAVVRSGGKQIRVAPGDAVWVERLAGGIGDAVELSEVLLIGDEGATRIGTPNLEGARVVGKITAQDRGPKLTIYRMKRRKNYRRKQGHRQHYTQIRIERIEG